MLTTYNRVLPCDFCGKLTKVTTWSTSLPDKLIECERCKNIGPQQSEPDKLSHEGIIKLTSPLMTKSVSKGLGFGCHIWFSEVHAGNGKNRESPDLIGFRNDNETYMVEVKATRSDFLNDKKKLFRSKPELGMGNFRYYSCPEGLINENELPDKWGLIYIVDVKGRYVARIIKRAEEIKHRNHAAEQTLLFSLLRRINNYAPVKELVEYDKIVNKQVSAQMDRNRTNKKVEMVKRIRDHFWSQLIKKFTYCRN